MDVRERLPSAPTLSNTLKHLIPNACIAQNIFSNQAELLTINAMAVRERLSSAPTLSNTEKHLSTNACIAKNIL